MKTKIIIIVSFLGITFGNAQFLEYKYSKKFRRDRTELACNYVKAWNSRIHSGELDAKTLKKIKAAKIACNLGWTHLINFKP